MALLADGTVMTWGAGASGQLGNNASSNSFVPVPVSTATGLIQATQIDAGGSHCIAHSTKGDIYTWGANLYGQLGIGNTTDQDEPAYSSGLSAGTTIDVAAGDIFSMVLIDDGTTWVCGANNTFQLSICSSTSNQPTPISGFTFANAVSITVPSIASHGWAITSSGQLYTWGDNFYGCAGDGGSSTQVCPAVINGSGSGLCAMKPSADNHPQPCCVAVQDDNRTKLGENGDQTYSGGFNYSGIDMSIQNTITLNPGSYFFTNCDVICWKDAKIVVKSGARLYIRSNSHLYACGDMWDGILIENGGRAFVYSGSLIEDAEIALDVEQDGYYYATDATFNRNYRHIQHIGPNSPSYNPYRIRRSKFLCQTTASIGGAPVHENLLPPRENEITLIQVSGVDVNAILVGSSGNGNTFDNAVFGVTANDVADVEILYNDFDDVGLFGTYVTNTPSVGGETIDITNNTYDRSIYPIFCYDNDYRVRTHITYNTIDFAGMATPPDFMTGITVGEITPASGNQANDEYNYVDVSHNYIYNAPCGINLSNMLGNRLSPVAKLYVGDNIITHTKPNNDWQAGIKTDYVSEIAISNNTISHPTGYTNWWETSIRVSNGSHNSVTCNYLSNHGKAIYTDNDIRPSSIFVENEMQSHDAGFFMNYSIIGAQGTVAEPHDNQWNGSWSGKAHIECYGSSSYGPDSPFAVRSSGSTYYPTNRSGTNFGVAVPTPTTTSNTWPNGCQYSGPSFKTDDGEISPASEALGIILGSESFGSEVEEAMNWNARFNLYRHLENNDELLYADEAITAFHSEQNEGNIGKFYRAISAFNRPENELSEESNHISVIQSLLLESRPEQTLKNVLEVLLSNATDLTNMGAENEAVLREMAQRCPIDDGFGVYITRSALLKIDTLPKNYVADCERVPSPDQISEKQGLAETDGFLVYPNPSNGYITIDYKIEIVDIGMLRIYDMLGGLLASKRLNNDDSSIMIELNNLANGLYLLEVEVNNQRKLSERISVIKP